MPYILVIDDNPTDRLLIIRELEREFTELRVTEIINTKVFAQAMDQGGFDVVITDYQLGWSDGLTVLKQLKSRYPECPVIMFTNSGNEEIAVEAMKSGLDDYIIKAPNRYIRVPTAVRLALERAEWRQKAKRLQEERDLLLVKERAARAEAEEANRLKDEFLANLSHELRTPLNAMFGWVQLLRLQRLKDDDYSRATETIERNAKSLAQIIEDLLDVSRIVTGKLALNMHPVELIPVIEAALSTVRPAAQAKAIEIECKLEPEAGSISGDALRLQQIIWNLLSNAVKFTPEGGRVQIQLMRGGAKVVLIVSDTGIGICPEFLPYVFDRFRQADSSSTRIHSGLGLGLAIVRHLVELHGGTVQADSLGKEEGATFTVQFPLLAIRTPPKDAFQESATEKPSGILNGVKVLVVDDQTDVREVMALLLEEYDAQVKTARSVEEAIAVFAAFQPDVLISDISMPIQDGYDLMRQIKAMVTEQAQKIPQLSPAMPKAIALTGYAGDEDRDRALAAGFHLHLSKPVDAPELVALVAKLMGRFPQ
jgi:signal transduction histidine kinase